MTRVVHAALDASKVSDVEALIEYEKSTQHRDGVLLRLAMICDRMEESA